MKNSTFMVYMAVFSIAFMLSNFSSAEIIPVSHTTGKKYLPVSEKSENRGNEDGTLICWLDESKSGSLYAQKINSSGEKLWDPKGVMVNSNLGSVFTSDTDFPDIYSDKKGGAVIIYRKVFFAAEEIYCSKISSDGTVSEAVNLSSHFGGYNFSPVSKMTFDNGIIVAWENFTAGDFNIQAQKIDLSCMKLWNRGNEIVVCANEMDQRKPSITCDSENNAIITWLDSRNISGPDISGFDIYANKIDKFGNYTFLSDTGKLVMKFPEIENAGKVNYSHAKIPNENTDNNGHINLLKEGSYNHSSVLSGKRSVIIVYEIDIMDRDSYINLVKVDNLLNQEWEKVLNFESFQSNPLLISDKNNGVCVFWDDSRNNENNIYGLNINSSGDIVNCNPDGNKITSGNIKNDSKKELPDRYNRNGINIFNKKVFIPFSEKESGNVFLSDFKIQNTADAVNYPSVICENSEDNCVSVTFLNGSEVLVLKKNNVIYASVRTEKFKSEKASTGETSLSNYPNPFNPVTKISYELPADEFVSVKIYDMNGRVVSSLLNDYQNKGRHEFTFNGNNLSSGVYYCRLETGSYTKVLKMMLTK